MSNFNRLKASFKNRALQFPFFLFGTYILFFSEKRGILTVLLLLQAIVTYFIYRKIKFHKVFVINSSLFIVYIFSFLFFSNDKSTLKVFETGLSMALMPLIFLIFKNNNKEIFSKKNEDKFFNIFFYSCFLFCLINFFYLFNLGFLSTEKPYIYFLNQVSKNIPIVYDHPIYTSLILGVSLLSIIKKVYEEKRKIKFQELFGILTIVLFLLFLSRKGVIIAFVISGFFLLKEKFLKRGVLFIIFSVFLITIIPFTRERMVALINLESYIKANETNSVNNRLNIYKCAIDKIKSKPLFGYGINDDKKVLYDCYKQTLYYLYEMKFNTHNQYLSIMMKSGLFGLLIFLFMMAFNLKIAIVNNDILYLTLLIYFMIIMLFENILERQNGVMIFSFLINYFAFKSLQKISLDNEA